MIARRAPSTAPERTVLAWRRSGLSVVAAGLAIARGIPTLEEVPSRPYIGWSAVGLGALAIAVGNQRSHVRARRIGTDRPAADLADLWPMSATAVVVALGAAVVALLN